MTTSSPLPYTLLDVINAFGQREMSKAQPYLAGAVKNLSISGDEISATVQGTERSPYRVDITVSSDSRKGVVFYSDCTCPVGEGCKHVVATLLMVLKHQVLVQRSAGDRAAVLRWAEAFKTCATQKPGKEALIYRIRLSAQHSPYAQLDMEKARLAADGRPHLDSAKSWSNVDGALRNRPGFVRDEDLPILKLIYNPSSSFLALNQAPDVLMELLLATGRLYLDEGKEPLHLAEARAATIQWLEQGHRVQPRLLVEPDAPTFAVSSFWYIDKNSGACGRVTLAEEPRVIKHLLELPPLDEQDHALVSGLMAELAPSLPPPSAVKLEPIDVMPRPLLRIQTVRAHFYAPWRGYHGVGVDTDVAELFFAYQGVVLRQDDKSTIFNNAEGGAVLIKRHLKEEARWARQLEHYGFLRAPAYPFSHEIKGHLYYALENEASWYGFIKTALPEMRAEGWEFEFPKDFRHFWLEAEDWDATVHDSGNGWFDLDMGVVVEGQRMALTPMLAELFARDPRWLEAGFLHEQADDADVMLLTPDKQRVRVDAGRVKTIVRHLIDLFERPSGKSAPAQTSLRLHNLDALRLENLPDDMPTDGAQQILAMAQRIRDAGSPKAVEPPAGLGLELRPYQLEGLAWLTHLRDIELGGILADDMGLGKTAQTLAFLLREKQQGRLERPALIILPTSLLFNWRREAAHITPALRILTLHGTERHEAFEHIADHDLVLTTYPLLWRDIERLEQEQWSMLVLDEAQTVKNEASQAAQSIRRLQADHRLCLTGTPMENHLGELWSQFDFLLPGFLGDKTYFTRTFRTPIEKGGDTLRRDVLARRLRPFMLRRRKEDVAAELPPKSIILRSVELEGAQRDLYETVRAAMDEKVRQSIASKGFARSHIVILEALLKLRQVCCDPRLLATASKRKIGSAKLDLLMDMLPELVAEGHRILLFSQFTTMLELISQALEKAKLAHVILTGETRDRESVVRTFQEGAAPIFLISLKAGGVGLNLTAADTVIHYDPWWNPAVEDQATDRAHRIGQTRQVFVYKLLTEGSIEEKILALQEKKAELAAGVLSEDASALSKFSEQDLQALLAPLAS